MVAILPKFNQIFQACPKKFEAIFNAYKENKMSNGISSNNWQEKKLYDALDKWYHQAR